jgi:hypothetical protein
LPACFPWHSSRPQQSRTKVSSTLENQGNILPISRLPTETFAGTSLSKFGNAYGDMLPVQCPPLPTAI